MQIAAKRIKAELKRNFEKDVAHAGGVRLIVYNEGSKWYDVPMPVALINLIWRI